MLVGLSLASIISKLATEASRQLGILHHIKAFLGTPELLFTCKAFIPSLMEYCSPLCAGSPAFPSTLLSLMPWKQSPSRSLESPMMRMSLWVYYFPIVVEN